VGRILTFLGIGVVVIGAGVGALLFWAHGKGEETQERFFHAALGDDPAKLMALFHENLRVQVDEPVLAVWMGALRNHLGEFQGLAGSEFSTNASTKNGHSRVESEGKVRFSKAEAKSKLVYEDDHVIAFEVTSDALPQPWLTTSPDPSSYEKRAGEFLGHMLAARGAEAYAMMHESLQRQLTAEKISGGMAALTERLGAVKDVRPSRHEFSAEGTPQLKFFYAIEFERNTIEAWVRFEFTPWKGYLVGFDVSTN